MKLRLGFISNSSSTSFCIFGVCIDTDDIDKILNLVEDGDNDNYDLREEALEKLCDKTNLTFINEGESDQVFLGRNYTSIKNDETGKQFKTSVIETLKDIGITQKCETHEEVIYG